MEFLNRVLTKLLITALSCAALAMSAQNVTVINRLHGEPIDAVPETYVLTEVTEERFIINEYEPALRGNEALVYQMIAFGLKSFIDSNYLIKNSEIRVYASALDFDQGTSAVVKNAIWINDLPFSELFEGFSDHVLNQAVYLAELNGRELVDAADRNKRGGDVNLYEFQSLVYKLKKSALFEVSVFLHSYLLQDEAIISDSVAPFLPLEEFELVATPSFEDKLDELSLNPEIFETAEKPQKKSKRRTNGFSDQVVELLEENNRILGDYAAMFQNLQRQIDDINEMGNSELREEVANMRQMISELKKEPVREESRGETVFLIFGKNEFSLTQAQKTTLNRAVILLAKRPSKKALVTGYADKSGNAEYNVWISQQRAQSVEQFMVSMGIDRNRIVVTYLGDTESTASTPADRRVEVSIIN